jgi:tetratricopeptide (TPR) repeat protein
MNEESIVAALSHLKILLNADRFDDAMGFVTSLDRKYPADKGDIHCLRGSVYDCQGELRLAETEYREAAGFAESRLHPEALFRHAYTLQSLDQIEEALEQAQKLVQLYPEFSDGNSLSLLGELLHESGRHDEALQYLESAHRAAPTNRRVSWVMIRSYYFAGSLYKGRTKLYEILGANKEDWDLLLVLAEGLADARKNESALELYLWHLKERPRIPNVVTGAICVALRLNQMDAFESVARVLVTQVERPGKGGQKIAEVLFARDHYDDMHELLKELLERTGTDDWALKSLAASLAFHLGRYQDAYRVAIGVLKVHDDFEFMRSVAGMAAAQLQMYLEAVELIELYFERNEIEPGLMHLLGTCEWNRCNFPEALAAMEFCLAEDPNDFKSRSIFAAALHQLGRLHEAKEQYEQCLSYNPEDRESLYGLMFLLDEIGEKIGSKKIADYLVSVGHNTDTQDFQDIIRQNQWQF